MRAHQAPVFIASIMLGCHKASRLKVLTLLSVLLALGVMPFVLGQDTPTNPQAQYVLVISIDGLQPDAIDESHAPNLHKLIREGTYCPVAKTIRRSVTLPAHVSMLTGLGLKKHKVRWNRYRRGHYRGGTLFSIAKKAGLSTAIFFAKKKLNYLADSKVFDFVYGAQPKRKKGVDITATGLATAFAREWPAKKYSFTFVHIRKPDKAGHHHRWMSKTYLQAVTEADRAIGAIVATLKRADAWQQTALIVLADHGGSGYNHRSAKPANKTIPWIVVGPGVPMGLVIERTIHIYDTAPTALAFRGLTMPGDIDGQVVNEVVRANRGS